MILKVVGVDTELNSLSNGGIFNEGEDLHPHTHPHPHLGWKSYFLPDDSLENTTIS
jgi:hypothetical protein